MTIRILTAAVAAFCFAGGAHASELDRESQVVNEQSIRAKELPGTVVVRVNEKTGEASVLELGEHLEAGADNARSVAAMAGFKSVPSSGLQSDLQSPAGELDRNSSSSSWYAWYNYNSYYAPTYYYWGYRYDYRSYYSYNWYGYSYYWYRWW